MTTPDPLAHVTGPTWQADSVSACGMARAAPAPRAGQMAPNGSVLSQR